MTPNVVQIVQAALTPEVTAAAAERLGEQPGAVAAALGAAGPGVFALLTRRAGETGGPEALLAAIRGGGVAFSLNDPLGRLKTDDASEAAVLGEDGSALAQRVADFAGVEAVSGAALVGMVTPLALGALARTAPPPLNAETLGRTLREQGNNIDRAFPPGFTMGAPDVGLSAQREAAPAASAAPPSSGPDRVMAAEAAAASGGGEAVLFPAPGPAPAAQPPARTAGAPSEGGLPKWLLPLLAALILLGAAFVLMRMLGDEPGPTVAPDAGSQAAVERGAPGRPAQP